MVFPSRSFLFLFQPPHSPFLRLLLPFLHPEEGHLPQHLQQSGRLVVFFSLHCERNFRHRLVVEACWWWCWQKTKYDCDYGSNCNLLGDKIPGQHGAPNDFDGLMTTWVWRAKLYHLSEFELTRQPCQNIQENILRHLSKVIGILIKKLLRNGFKGVSTNWN